MHQGASLNDLIYKRIRNDIMDLTLEPGTTVSVQKLADMYGASRTPAREAVIRLQKENLVEIYPQAKTMISKINLERIQQERFIRKALELALVDDFIQHCSSLVIDAMGYVVTVQKKYMNQKKNREFFVSDNNFHRIIFETARKTLAWETINDVVSHDNRFRILSTRIDGIDRTIVSEHEEIMGAAKDKDAPRMRKILDAHLDKSQNGLEILLDRYPNYFVDVKHERGK
jgi:DNA-binding GntR family transcriptional regulator